MIAAGPTEEVLRDPAVPESGDAVGVTPAVGTDAT